MKNEIKLENITPVEFAGFVGGSIFTAKFVKKDGSVRVINCRREVKKHLAGGERAWDFEKKGYVNVYDLQAEGYRVINLSTLIELRAKGVTLTNSVMQASAIQAEIERLQVTLTAMAA